MNAVSMRADARRNRLTILAAAEAVFAEKGASVPVDEVARRAGVGVGTLYRHFPTKEALFAAVIVHHMERLRDEARALADSDDPGGALFEFLALMAREGTSKRNLVDALSGAGIDIKDAAADTKAELEQAAGRLLARAQEAGQVRPDVTLADLVGLVMGACTAGEGGPPAGCSSARMISVVCDGLRAMASPR
ncbi:MAG TPA: helix-turn-helix domain-containing protein [Acidimicrobiales bacterium]|nr:helix-turn-helix domain-containing protein [Acidimicrobiales bacterium]